MVSSFLVALSLAVAGQAGAVDFTVTKLVDSNDGLCDADCSLREAILDANAQGGEDRVLLGAGVHLLSLPGQGEDLGMTGDLDITDDTILLGIGARSSIIDGGAIDRVLDVESGSTLTVEGLTIRNGLLSSGGGAGIAAGNANVTIIGCAVTDNHVQGAGFGGGLAGGSLTILDATISGNTTGGGGGGLNVSQATIRNTTFSDNESLNDFGGAIYVFGDDSITADNVTIVNNRASAFGGGVLVEGGGVFSLSNSVIADNNAGTGPDCQGTVLSRGYNLIGINSVCSGFGATGDQIGTAGSPIDPLLADLANNGGPTDTHLPLVGSPLVDTGNPARVDSSPDACSSADQRGTLRPLDGDGDSTPQCDIGSVELGSLFSDGFESGDTTNWTLTFP